jgi:hypothetical protein
MAAPHVQAQRRFLGRTVATTVVEESRVRLRRRGGVMVSRIGGDAVMPAAAGCRGPPSRRHSRVMMLQRTVGAWISEV